ncbi:hypothetical protein A2U01_0005065 [Trifolium medium]|uniref:Uncharacterized protein n=1 Tax=Trifolium medium TaxID=97028 RepID=A0A392MD79_9FABA|nr:hypothetical protein [Trifolium medium]
MRSGGCDMKGQIASLPSATSGALDVFDLAPWIKATIQMGGGVTLARAGASAGDLPIMTGDPFAVFLDFLSSPSSSTTFLQGCKWWLAPFPSHKRWFSRISGEKFTVLAAFHLSGTVVIGVLRLSNYRFLGFNEGQRRAFMRLCEQV